MLTTGGAEKWTQSWKRLQDTEYYDPGTRKRTDGGQYPVLMNWQAIYLIMRSSFTDHGP